MKTPANSSSGSHAAALSPALASGGGSSSMPPLQMTERLVLQTAYLQGHCGGLLLGALPEPMQSVPDLLEVAGWREDLPRFGAHVLARARKVRRGPAAAELDPTLHRFWDAAMSLAGRRLWCCKGAPPSTQLNGWTWRMRFRQLPDALPVFSEATIRGVLLSHELVLHQAAVWTAANNNAGAWIERHAQACIQPAIDRLNGLLLDNGDLTSHLIAVAACHHCLSAVRGLTTGGAGQGPDLGDLWPDLTPPVKDAIKSFAARNPLVQEEYPSVRRALPKMDPTPVIARGVAETHRQLQQFTRWLLGGSRSEFQTSPLLIGGAARAAVDGFAAMQSPLRQPEEIRHLRHFMFRHLRECERRLLESTVRPAAVIHDVFLHWLRAEVLLDRACQFPVTPVSMYAALYCHALLASAEEETANAKAKDKALYLARKRFAECPMELGDVFFVDLACQGLRRRLGARLTRNPQATWNEIFAASSQRLEDGVLHLAGSSPMARIRHLELEGRLHKGQIPWTGLDEFLRNPVAGPLRAELAESLFRQSIELPAPARPGLARVLRKCLDDGGPNGLEFAGNVLRRLVQRLFELLETADTAPGNSRDEQEANRGDLPTAEFTGWFPEIRGKSDGVLLGLIVAFRLAAHRMSKPDRLPARSVPRQRWQDILTPAVAAAHGRTRRTETQDVIARFWCAFGAAALREDDFPERLGGGISGWNDLPTVCCRMMARVLRRVFDARRRLGNPLITGQNIEPEHDAGGGSQLDDLHALRRLVQSAVDSPRFRRALMARRYLVAQDTPVDASAAASSLQMDPERAKRLVNDFNRNLGTDDGDYRWDPLQFADT